MAVTDQVVGALKLLKGNRAKGLACLVSSRVTTCQLAGKDRSI
jgi:hypothetical protein